MNRRGAALIVGVTMLVGACTADSDSPASVSDRTIECSEIATGFEAWAAAGFSGTIAISTGGKEDCSLAYGDTTITTETVFSIGSITKSFTAAAIFALVDDGKLSIEDRAGDLVPDLGGPVANVTVGQLLTHTSGLTGNHGSDEQPLGHDEALAAISNLGVAFAPGSDVLYSNAGYTLLALIIEETSAMSYRDFMVTRVLPLPDGHVAGGFWEAGPHWALDGNGGLAMTTRDLASWTHALFTGQVVSPEAVARIRTPVFDVGDGTSETPGWVALDDKVFGEPGLAAAGGGDSTGHNAVVVWLPSSERVVAMASNTAKVTAEDLLRAVGPALVAGDPLPTPRDDEVALDPGALDAVVGRYELDSGGSFEVSSRDARLVVTATGPDAVPALFPIPDDIGATRIAEHEADVLALLAGATDEGRDERKALETDIGTLDDVELAGTLFDDGELRTYVTVTSGNETAVVWYALDEEGSVAAVEITDRLPSRSFVSTTGGFRPDEPSASEPTIAFDDNRMTLSGPDGATTTTAARSAR
ncbi:serine hydrolase domain-containing protein [Antrihabitans sp. NCIMB 15449]|uniref:Serine hydrolase domain-containing protein n=1 Tax=Antrihabitans spumae TaxID=3373370 RepID=A0ABW7JHG3_9NOCA